MGLSSRIHSLGCRTCVFLPQKKRALILFELLIALTLATTLITLLFSFFVESAKVEKKLQTARSAILNRAHLQTRLQNLFTSLDVGQECFSFQKELSLIFDNGADPDPLFGGNIRGKILLDSENLCLITQPLDPSPDLPKRREILFSSVKNFEFKFLGSLGTDTKGEEKINETLAWKNTWSLKSPPSMIRLKVEEKSGSFLEFAFLLPTSNDLVTYEGAP